MSLRAARAVVVAIFGEEAARSIEHLAQEIAMRDLRRHQRRVAKQNRELHDDDEEE